QEIGEAIQHPDDRLEDIVKKLQWSRYPHGCRHRTLYCDRFRCKLSKYNMQKGYNAECKYMSEVFSNLPRQFDIKNTKNLVNDLCHNSLSYPTESKRSQCDA